MNKRISAIILLVAAVVIWGSAFAVTKASLAEVPPVLLALLRFAVASALLWFLAARRGGLLTKLPRPAPVGTIALMGASGVFLYYLAYNFALVHTSATQAAIIQSFIPIVTALLAFFFLREALSTVRIIGIAVSIAGIFLILAAGETGADAPNPLAGNLLVLASVVIWSAYTIFAKRLAHLDQTVVTAGATLFGTILLAPAAIFEIAVVGLPRISLFGWASIVYLGAFSSAAGMLLYNRSLQHLSASQTANFLNLMPLVAVLTAVLFLGESVSLWQFAGGALVLGGVWISLQNRSRANLKKLAEMPSSG